MKHRGFVLFILLFFVPMIVFAQDTCPIDTGDVLDAAAEACSDLESNQVCFGHAPIDTLINCEDTFEFDSTGDIIPLTAICALRLGALTPEGDWGVAKAKLQIQGREDVAIELIMFGQLEAQNAASSLSEMEVWVESDTELRTGPASNFDAIMPITAGQTLRANACNCTANWLRVILDDGRVGWIPTNRVTIVGGSTEDLPVVTMDTPVYESLQAFTLRTGTADSGCGDMPMSGMMIQAPMDVEGGVPIEVNGVSVTFDSTILVRSVPDEQLEIHVLDGTAVATLNNRDMTFAAGAQAIVPLNDTAFPDGDVSFAMSDADDVANLPLQMLSRPIDPLASLEVRIPQIVGTEYCEIVSSMGEQECPIYFINRDGDEIVQMDVNFVDAPIGEWESDIQEMPALTSGDSTLGALAWTSACSLGSENFIGPVEWEITLTDAEGHVSAPFVASFNCVDG